MKRILKGLIFVLFGMLSFTGLLFGCAGKYDNVKVTSDKDDTGLQLYLGEDTEGDVRSVGTITFYVENLEDGAENLKLNFEGYEESKIVTILSKSVSGNSLTVTLKAISGGSTNLVALTEAGMKKDSVKVDCIKRLQSFSFAENYSPAMFNVPGSKYTVDTKKINFLPNDTTQNQVAYSIEPAVDGASITSGGVLTLSKKVASPINVVARSVDNQNIFDTVAVHLIDPIQTETSDGVEIYTTSNLYNNGQIMLARDGDDSFMTFRVDVNTTEKITYGYRLQNISDSASGNINCVNVEQKDSEFIVRSNEIGECKLVLSISFAEYNDAPIVEKEISIKVVELPKTISVNGQTQNFSDNIYTYYENNKGKEYVVNIGDAIAYNKTYMIAVDDGSLLTVCRNDGKTIAPAKISNGKLASDGDILQSGQSIFVKGLQANKTAKLYIIAYGTANFNTLLVKEIRLNILLGSQTVKPEYRTLDGELDPTYYVEIGNSFELEYSIDSNSSAYGIQLVQADGGELDSIISADVSTGLKPTITVNALELGEISCKLLLDNLVESKSFVIKVFKQIEYSNQELDGGIFFSVDSPLQNPSIASAEYRYEDSNRTLDSFVLSLGKTVKLSHVINPEDATIYNLTYSSVIVRGEDQLPATDYLYVSESGNITARKILPESVVVDGQSISQYLAVLVKVESLATNDSGDVIKVSATKKIVVDIYLPISDVKISKQTSTIYWNNGRTLNPVQVDKGSYLDTIDLTVYSDAINLLKVQVNWNCPSELSLAINNGGLSATVSAFDMPDNAPDKSIYTVTATIQYFSTTIIRRCIFTVVNPTRANSILAYVDDIDSDVAYFELGQNNQSTPENNTENIKINSAVYSASGKQDVTFSTVYYMSRNENVAVVDQNGVITPVGAGKTEIWVYAEDMMPRLSAVGEYRVINVIVADGTSIESAFRVRSEADFARIAEKPKLYYYFSSDVSLTNKYQIEKFGGHIEGNNYSLTGVVLIAEKPSLFGEIEQGAVISNLNISASYNISANGNVSLAGIAQTNNGTIENVSVYFVNSVVTVTSDISLNIAGLVVENNETISNSSVSANFEVKANEKANEDNIELSSEDNIELSSLNIGGLVAKNNATATMYGSNQNYEYRPLSSVQSYDFSGSIKVDNNITSTNSSVGGIFAVNNANISEHLQSYYGFATNIIIDAQSINNVGGIAGQNNGDIQDALVVADIKANSNVGGIAGINTGAINNAVVEMYQSVSDQTVFGKVQGNKNVGGIVGLGQKYVKTEDQNLDATKTYYEKNGENYVLTTDTVFDQEKTYYELKPSPTIQNSYVYAYATESFVGGENYVGGVVGYAQYTNISKSYANTKIKSVQNSGESVQNSGERVQSFGGISGYADNVSIENAYAIVSQDGATTFGSAVGSAKAAVGSAKANVSITNFYSTFDGNMVGQGSGSVEAKNCYLISEQITLEKLKKFDTYSNWSISNSGHYDNENKKYYDWFISNTENDGYPTLIYNGFLMRKLQPTQINIAIVSETQKINDVVVLNANQLYALSDVLTISTDVTSKANIYVYSSVNGILNTKNTTNLLSSRATLKSTDEQVVTLTFVLGNNPSIKEQIQIAFINEVTTFVIDNLYVKLNQTVALHAQIDGVVLDSSSNYKLGIEESNLSNDQTTKQCISISNANTSDLNGSILFAGDSKIKGEAKFDKANIDVSLYYKLAYTDLNGNSQIAYYKVKSTILSLEVYAGASDINISSTSIDMTLIDVVTFTVTVDTDDTADQIIIKNPANSKIKYTNNSKFVSSDQILSDQSNTVSDSAEVELSVVTDNNGVQDGKLTVTFELRFKADYLDANSSLKFAKMFKEELKFYAKSNTNISKSITITVQPQNLLKIDLTNYPAGQKEGTTFDLPNKIPSNTLTPGQMGMLFVDIYPTYAYYDDIQIVSSVTSNGKAIHFIQVAEYKGKSTRYLEIRPNLNTIENGIILRKYSTVSFDDNNNPIYKFDGRFYLNTLISSNVEKEEIVTITATGITNITDADGNTTQLRQIINTIDIAIKPAPELKLTQTSQSNNYNTQIPVVENGATKYYNLIEVGQTIKFSIEQKNGLQVSSLAVSAQVNNNNVSSNTDDVDASKTLSTFSITASLTASLIDGTIKIKAGDIIKVKVTGSKIINGFLETIQSEELEYLVVDYIITGITVVGTVDGKMNFNVNEPKEVEAQITCSNNTDSELINYEINNVKYLFKYLLTKDKNYNSSKTYYIKDGDNKFIKFDGKEFDKDQKYYEESGSFWSSIVNEEHRWNLIFNEGAELATQSYDNSYIVYKTRTIKTGETTTYSNYGILATSKPNYTPKFKVGFSYHYELTKSGLELVIEPQDSTDTTSKNIETTVEMNINIKSDLDKPVTVYTIEDFYSMTTGTDYILMNDLWFGYEAAPEGVDAGKFAKDYTPFDLTANSFDGNMYKIHINGNCMNTNAGNTANFALFTSIASGTIFKNIDIVYEGGFSVDENTNMTATSIYFAGAVVRNSGIISNVYVYYKGDVNINTKSADGEVYIAGFAYNNDGKITYSSVYGPDLNTKLSKSDSENSNSNSNSKFKNIKLQSSRVGNISGFVGTNSDLISNCEIEFVGIENTAPASRNAKVAGFAISNSGTIYNSSAAGQRISTANKGNLTDSSSFTDNDIILPVKKNDDRVNDDRVKGDYFARLESNGNIAGFVYTNSGSIENAYSIFPMETQSRTAGFVFDNSNAGSVLASYTASFYDGSNANNSAYSPFVGTNQIGEVLNDAKNSVVRYCYYLLDEQEIYEEDITFKEPASRISMNLEEADSDSSDSIAISPSSYIGFDITGNRDSIWTSIGKYVLPCLNSNETNLSIRENFKRDHKTIEVNGSAQLYFSRAEEGAPYQIADALQFVNAFKEESIAYNDGTYYFNHDIRLINDIDLSEYAGTDKLNLIRQVVFNGDFDGNGMTISGLKLLGGSVTSTDNSNPYRYSSSSFGLFNQIGTATIATTTTENNITSYTYNNFGLNGATKPNAKIRSLTLKVDEVSKSTSVFSGILAGVIVNTDIKSLKIQSNNIYVLGRNAVGGVAGGIFGSSTLYNVSVNANVTSSYQQFAASAYKEKQFANVDTYEFIDYTKLDTTTIIDLAKNSNSTLLNCSYTGGVAGIVDLYNDKAYSTEVLYNDSYKNKSEKLTASDLAPNLNVITVYGNVTLIGEIVGGLFGTTNEDSYLGNCSFEVSATDSQKLQGYFVAGGLVGITNGSAIRYSKVEVSQAYADAYDNNLTNITGNALFDAQTYPYAIGGLVGAQRGGYLITSYSKTNVINARAKYAGGLVGYLTDFKSKYKGETTVNGNTIEIKNLKNGRFVLFEEVYTTGNVFAGVDVDGNGTPTSYVGGIVGCYNPTKIDKHNFDAFNGVMGINAFHMPNGLTLPTTYKVQGTQSYPTYSQIMAGYTGEREKADGTKETVVFKSRIGSIFGEIVSKFDVKYSKSSDTYNNLYINFVYDNKTITSSDCTNSRGSNIKAYATISNGKTFEANDIDIFTYMKGISTRIYVYLNKPAEETDTSKEYINNSNVYLVLRGNGSTSTYRQNNNSGIYQNWDDTWIFQSPIYPKFKPVNLVEYTEIRTEEDLENIRSGNKYKIVKDIYLRNNWISKFDLSFVKLNSAKRNDGAGISINGSQSPYYAIYNINISNNELGGFFNLLRYSEISNINFVFGTNFAQPGWSGDGNYYKGNVGSNITSGETNIGLLVGLLKSESLINNCNVVLNSNSNIDISSDSVKNVGIVAGEVNNSNILSTKVISGEVTQDNTLDVSSNSDPVKLTYNGTAIENISLGVGKSTNSTIDLEIQNCNLSIISSSFNADAVNIGGLIGSYEYKNPSIPNIRGGINNISIDVTNTNTSNKIYIGGVAGKANGVTISASKYPFSVNGKLTINLSNTDSTNRYVGGLFGELSSSSVNLNSESISSISITASNQFANNYLGGLVGELSSSTIEKVATDSISINNSGSFSSMSHVGGIVGKGSNSTISSISIAETNIVDTSTSKTQAYIGGAVGLLDGSVDISSIEIKGLTLIKQNKVGKLYLAGFAGAINDGSNDGSTCTITNSYAYGTIASSGSSTSGTYIGGFVASCMLASNPNSNAADISNCVADVNILFTENKPTVYVAGFAAQGSASIKKCASVGDIIFASSITTNNNEVTDFEYAKELFIGTAAGFTCQDGGTIRICFSFSTLKLVGDENASKVKATSFGSDHSIYFNYNLSGVFDLSVATSKYNFKYGVLLSCKVGNQKAGYQNIISNSKLFGIYNIGNNGDTKLNPKKHYKGDVYYTFGNSYVVDNCTEQISAPSITNDDDLFIAGFTFSSPIETNNGYIFNCAMVGSSGFSTTGFVNTNNGIINACGTNAIIDVNNQKNIDVAGFVLTNAGMVANSYAANIYKNQTTETSVSGFVNENSFEDTSGYIYNCFASPAMFDITGNYSKRNLFAPSNVSNYGNCYYDNQTSTTDQNTTSLTYTDMVNKSCEMFGKIKTNNETITEYLNVQAQNYGYATPFTFKGSHGIGKVGTGNNKSSVPYIINNFGRFAYLTNDARKSTVLDKKFYAKFVIDIDARKYNAENGIKFASKDVLTGTIEIQNDNLCAIYGIKLASDSSGLFSAATVNLENFGLVGTLYSKSISQSQGFVVGSADTLTATNCYAILDQDIIVQRDITVQQDITVQSEINFGALAGTVTTSAKIENCLAYAKSITVNATNANVGVMIGKSETTDIKSSYAAGTIKVTDNSYDDSNSENIKQSNVGGLAGYISSAKNLKDSWQYNKSFVAIENHTSQSASTLHINDFVGYNNGTKYEREYAGTHHALFTSDINYYNYYYVDHVIKQEYWLIGGVVDRYGYYNSGLSLTYSGQSTYKGVKSITNDDNWKDDDGLFGSNSIIKTELLTDGSLLNPIELTDPTNVKDYKYYYLSDDISLTSSISKNPAMIIGNGKTITMQESGALLSYSDSNATTVVSGLTITNGPLASGTFEGYAYKVTTNGTRKTNYGFVNAESGAVFDTCTSTEEIAPESTVTSASGFANTYGGGYYRSITVNATLNISAETQDNLFSGMFNNLGNGNHDVLADHCNRIDITLTLKSNASSDNYIGGIIAKYEGKSAANNTNNNLKAKVTSFTLKGIDIINTNSLFVSNYVGGIVGYLKNRTIEFAIVDTFQIESITSTFENYIGGIAGFGGTITTATVEKSFGISGTISGAYNHIGGISGCNTKITTCTVSEFTISGTITGTMSNCIGGITGFGGTITTAATVKSFSISGTISGTNNYIGGIAGYGGTITTATVKSFSISDTISGTNNYIGGIAGYGETITTATVEESFGISGTITGTNNNYIGGIAGYSTSSINSPKVDSYTISGTITVDTANSKVRNYIGGIAGYSESSIESPTVDSYTISGTINAQNGTNYIGGIAGYSSDSITQVTISFNKCDISNSGTTYIAQIASIDKEYSSGSVTIKNIDQPENMFSTIAVEKLVYTGSHAKKTFFYNYYTSYQAKDNKFEYFAISYYDYCIWNDKYGTETYKSSSQITKEDSTSGYEWRVKVN